jgi:hypothetical protein
MLEEIQMQKEVDLEWKTKEISGKFKVKVLHFLTELPH